jgi:2-haloacid dehalogenase
MHARAFDAYGTLFDVHAAVMRNAAEIGAEASRLSQLWRAKQLEYTWVLNGIGFYEDFWTLTQRALDTAIAMTGGLGDAMRGALLDAYATLEPYAEVVDALTALKAAGDPVIVFSNANRAMLERALASSGLERLVDHVVSVEAVGVFKPDPRTYMLLDPWRQAGALTFYSSNRWDIAGAAACGISSVWVNRVGNPEEYPGFSPVRTASTLAEALAA